MSTPIRIPLARPDIGPDERAAVDRVLSSDQLSLGPELRAFEEAMERFHEAPHAVAVSSGTAALHLALIALGLGPGDEVVTSPFSFIASANAMLYVGATPRFVDVDPHTLNLDAEQVAAAIGPRTRAILPVHVFGRPAPMEPILELAREHELLVIEDACEALGARLNGRPMGTLGDVGAFGFYPNKTITTGEGGILLARDEKIANTVRALRNQGRVPGVGLADHVHLGFNYRLSDIACALGRVQLARIDELIAERLRVTRLYDERLGDDPRIISPAAADAHMDLSPFVHVVRLAEDSVALRDRVHTGLVADGIGCGRYFQPIHLQPLYRERGFPGPGSFPHAERAGRTTLALPFHPRLTEAEVDEVCTRLGHHLDG